MRKKSINGKRMGNRMKRNEGRKSRRRRAEETPHLPVFPVEIVLFLIEYLHNYKIR